MFNQLVARAPSCVRGTYIEWRQVLEPILSRYEEKGVRRYFRADAAFAKPDIYEYMEERRVFYARGASLRYA